MGTRWLTFGSRERHELGEEANSSQADGDHGVSEKGPQPLRQLRLTCCGASLKLVEQLHHAACTDTAKHQPSAGLLYDWPLLCANNRSCGGQLKNCFSWHSREPAASSSEAQQLSGLCRICKSRLIGDHLWKG